MNGLFPCHPWSSGGPMSGNRGKNDYRALPSDYRRFYDAARAFIPTSRLLIDPFKTLAYGTDASFYRLIPKIIIKTESRDEVSYILRTAHGLKIPVTFRARVRASPARLSLTPSWSYSQEHGKNTQSIATGSG